MKRGESQGIRRGMIVGLVLFWGWGLVVPPLAGATMAPARPSISPQLTKPALTLIEPPFSRIPYQWEISGGTAIITGYTGNATDIEIPATVGTLTDRYPVTAIGSRVFMEQTRLTRVVIPEGVTFIGDEAFAYCRDLAEVVLPASLRDIGIGTFTGCRSLPRLEIPAAVTWIGVQAFSDTHELQEVWFLGPMPAITENRVNWNPFRHAIIPASLVIPGLPEAGDWGRVFSGDQVERLRLYYPAGAPGWVPTDQIRPFYSVTYDLNGGSGPIPRDDGRYPEGAKVSVLAPDPAVTWPDHQFLGWSTLAAGGGDSLAPGSAFPMGAAPLTLYAQWGSVIPILIPIRVVFDANGGTGPVPDPVDGTLGNALTLPGQGGLTRTSHRFTGWNTAPDGSGEAFPGATFIPRKDHLIQAVDGNFRLYAQWQGQAYTVIQLPPKSTVNEPFSLAAKCFEGDLPLTGRELIFRVDGRVVGRATTDAAGLASVSGITEPTAGTHQVEVAQLIDGIEKNAATADFTVAAARVFPMGVAAALAAAVIGGAMIVLRRLRDGKPPPPEESHRAPLIPPPGPLVAVDFPAAGVLGRPVPLKIGLVRGTPEFRESLEIIKRLAPPGARSVALDFRITAPGYTVKPPVSQISGHQTLTWHLDGTFEPLSWELTPQLPGGQPLEVELFYEGSRIDYQVLSADIAGLGEAVPAPAAIPKATPVSLESTRDRLEDLQTLTRQHPEAADCRTIQVEYRSAEDRIIYQLYERGASGPTEYSQTLPNQQAEMFQRIQVFTEFLDGIVPVDEAPPTEWENIYLNLAFRCQNLFHLLVPPELVQRATQWTVGSTLVISSNEGWIPWEALHDGSEYWGTRLILGRYPRMTDPGQAPGQDRPKAGPLEIRWITNVIGGRLAPATLDQARKLFADQPGVTVKPLIERSLADLVGVLPQTDLLHLTCHGSSETPMLAIARGDTDYMNLNLDIVGNLPVKPGSFIFANACYSNSAVSQFRILTSFGWEFYKDGAGIYIGTLARVPEVYAMEFAREFYRRMFSADDRTVGQVLYELKKELAGRRNLHWLMYSMYGDPNQTFAARPGSGE